MRCLLLVILLLACCVAPAVASAIRSVPGFSANALSRNDDGSSFPVQIGFPINFFGRQYDKVYVNNNGNITFDFPLPVYTPFGLTGTRQVIIAPFFADVDTRNTTSGFVTYGSSIVHGKRMFGVNYFNVGYYNARADKRNTFQLILIDRSDTGSGNFDIEFNYDTLTWETGDASGGSLGFGGASAHAGYSNGNGTPGTSFEIAGSGRNGFFLNSARTGLVWSSSPGDPRGRYVFKARNGTVQSNVPGENVPPPPPETPPDLN